MATQTSFKRSELVSLFQALGWKSADGWTGAELKKFNVMAQKLPAKLKDEGNEAAKAAKKLGDDQKELLDQIVGLVESGETLEIEDEPKAKGSKKDGGKSGKGSAKDKAEKKPAKKEAETDKWGARLGSKRAAMNAQFGKKAKSMKEICEAAGCNMKYNYVRKLIDEGKIVQTEDGLYKLA